MIITLAYSEQPSHNYNIANAIKDKSHPIRIFQVEIVSDSISSVGETYTTKLLDNQKWQLKNNHRLASSFTTKPTINLEEVTPIGTIKVSVKEALEAWFYARVKWIAMNGFQTTDDKTKNLLQVVRLDDGLTYTQTSGINYLETAQIKFESTRSFV